MTTNIPILSPLARSWRPWVVWGSATFCYVVAIFSRTSLSATGISAAERFHVDSAVLASFAVLQLIVYAGMQVPVGILIDRFGARTLIITGALVMTVGQVLLALASLTGVAILARALVGAGDAMTFISVIRLIPSWFPPRRIPILTQITGMTGQLGQIASVIPLVAVMSAHGWTAAFLGVAGVTGLSALLSFMLVFNAPYRPERMAPSISFRSALAGIPESWKHPGTRLGFWSHFVTPFAGASFTLLWGYPFLLSGEGVTQETAASLYVLLVVLSAVFSLIMAQLVIRFPLHRSRVVLSIVGFQVLVWTGIMLFPGPAPLWLIVLLFVTFAIGGPGSLIGFDIAQQFTPAHRQGGASGLVNSAGFMAAVVALFAYGYALDLLGAGTPETYTREAFRTAMLVYYPLWAVGVTGVLISRRQIRRWAAQQGDSNN
ncbi:MFS transporter [Lysinibacter sp. HNR]|uniref:MFS transporter n=1 Tax=Lysinibacter sp. HNR TaxID=3031408 RepID=UPI00243523DF|nr:MFS transporter [Lysinibacter sp. HNR]WGD36489.1 MFS transporter [Lysinibacter sp. HNR]